MTEAEKYEIATLATELERARQRCERQQILNMPADPVAREKAAIDFAIAQVEYSEAIAALSRAQGRIVGKLR